MILIYSKNVDDFVNQVIDYLDDDFIRIGDRDKMFIEEISIDHNQRHFKISNEFTDFIDIEKLDAIWFNGGFANTNGNEYENECYSMLFNSFLNGKKSNNTGRVYGEFEISKLAVLQEARNQGLKIPATLITGSKEKLLRFFNKYINEGIICKRILDQLFYSNDEHIFDFSITFEVDSAIMVDIPKNFAISLFQERILADFEIRVIFMKNQFYSASIHVSDDKVDYRTKLKSLKKIRIVPFELPKNIKEKLSNLFCALNVNYCSADLMYSNNEYYFLEINKTGQISFINNACNFYLEKELSKLLRK